MSLRLRQAIWTTVFIAMMALLVVMSWDMAENNPVIFGMVILSALIGALGFAYARHCWVDDAYSVTAACVFVGVLAIGVSATLSASYWSSVVATLNEAAASEQTAAASRKVVSETRAKRLSIIGNNKTPDQIRAAIAVAQKDRLWTATNSCANSSAMNARGFCQDIDRLRGELAAAEETQRLEETLWREGTSVQSQHAKRDLVKGAILLANVTGLSVNDAIARIVIILVLFSESVLALSLYIGFAPVGRKEGSGLALAPVPAGAPVKPTPPSPRPPRGGLPMVENVVPLKRVTSSAKVAKQQRIDDANVASIRDFVTDRLVICDLDRTEKGFRRAGGERATVIYDEYRNWCRQTDTHALGKIFFGRYLQEAIDAARGADGMYYGATVRSSLKRRA